VIEYRQIALVLDETVQGDTEECRYVKKKGAWFSPYTVLWAMFGWAGNLVSRRQRLPTSRLTQHPFSCSEQRSALLVSHVTTRRAGICSFHQMISLAQQPGQLSERHLDLVFHGCILCGLYLPETSGRTLRLILRIWRVVICIAAFNALLGRGRGRDRAVNAPLFAIGLKRGT